MDFEKLVVEENLAHKARNTLLKKIRKKLLASLNEKVQKQQSAISRSLWK